MDMQKFYTSIRAIAARLDPETEQVVRIDPTFTPSQHFRRSQKVIWLVSIDNEEKGSVAGQVTEANPLVAAECLFWKTHELATEEQIAREQKRREQARVEILATDAAAKQTVNTTVRIDAQELAEAVLAATATARQPGRAPKAQPAE